MTKVISIFIGLICLTNFNLAYADDPTDPCMELQNIPAVALPSNTEQQDMPSYFIKCFTNTPNKNNDSATNSFQTPQLKSPAAKPIQQKNTIQTEPVKKKTEKNNNSIFNF